PTCSRPASNCGLISTTASPCQTSPSPASAHNTAGNTSVAEINETSIERNEIASAPTNSPAPSSRALHLSINRTRASTRSLCAICPYPVSTARTEAAPCCNMQSVNPPVEAPTSTHDLPSNEIPQYSNAL